MSERYRCFLVERVNERTVTDPADDGEPRDRYLFDVRRADTGDLVAEGVEHMSGNMPVGAMWRVEYLSAEADYRPSGPVDYGDRSPDELDTLRALAQAHPDWYPQVDPASGLPHRRPTHLFTSGPQLEVRTPGGTWNVDSRASNCGLPWDYEHRCWVRHGDPPDVTVDKAGTTCAAAAGSIQCGDYHGFLRNGWLEP